MNNIPSSLSLAKKVSGLTKEKQKPDRIIRVTIVKFEEQTTDSKF